MIAEVFEAAGRALVAVVLSAQAAVALDVRLAGVPQDSDLQQTLRGGSLLVEQAALETTPSTQEIVAAAQADYGRLLAVLYDNGYYGPVIRITLDGIDAANIPPVQPPAVVDRAVIEVTPGPLFRFGETQVTPVAPGTELPDGFRRGEAARLGVLKDTVSAAVDGWRAQGHAKAALASQDLTARHPTQTINARLRMAPGPRLRFGELRVTGNEAVRTERILAIAGLPTGQIYSPEELRLAAKRLRRTGAFSSVALLEAERIGPGDTLPITAQVSEAPPRRFGFGAELGSLEGLTLSAFWLHRNLFGGAEQLRLEGEVSGIGGNSGGEDYTLSAPVRTACDL